MHIFHVADYISAMVGGDCWPSSVPPLLPLHLNRRAQLKLPWAETWLPIKAGTDCLPDSRPRRSWGPSIGSAPLLLQQRLELLQLTLVWQQGHLTCSLPGQRCIRSNASELSMILNPIMKVQYLNLPA